MDRLWPHGPDEIMDASLVVNLGNSIDVIL